MHSRSPIRREPAMDQSARRGEGHARRTLWHIGPGRVIRRVCVYVYIDTYVGLEDQFTSSPQRQRASSRARQVWSFCEHAWFSCDTRSTSQLRGTMRGVPWSGFVLHDDGAATRGRCDSTMSGYYGAALLRSVGVATLWDHRAWCLVRRRRVGVLEMLRHDWR